MVTSSVLVEVATLQRLIICQVLLDERRDAFNAEALNELAEGRLVALGGRGDRIKLLDPFDDSTLGIELVVEECASVELELGGH